MRSAPIAVLLLTLILAYGSASAITFNDGLTHDVDYPVIDLDIENGPTGLPTTVSLSEGGFVDQNATVYGSSVLNVGPRSAVFDVNMFDASSATITGGGIHKLDTWDSSSIDVSGGTFSDNLTGRDTSSITISGGEFRMVVEAVVASSMTVTGGNFDTLSVQADAVLSVSGGDVRFLASYSTGELNLSGGEFTSLFAGDDSSVEIEGSTFAVDDTPVDFGVLAPPSGTLTGVLLSGDKLNVQFEQDGGNIVLVGTVGDIYEPNDSAEEATDLGSGLPQFLSDLSIEPPEDEDWFRWTAPASMAFTAEAFFTHARGDLDMEFLDSSLREIDVSESLTDNERVAGEVVAGQPYFVRVYGFGGATNSYDLVLSPEPGTGLLQIAALLGLAGLRRLRASPFWA